MFESLLGNTFTFWAILVLAALGGLVSERSGVINIGLEGKMLMAACLTAVLGAVTMNPAVGIVAAIVAGVVLSLLHWVLTQIYKVDQIVSGMAINLFALGCSNFLNAKFKQQLGTVVPTFPLWVFGVLALVFGGALAFKMARTRAGLRLRAVGYDPNKAREAGLDPIRIRFKALALTGVLCGLSGALVLSNTGTFSDNMTSGRGFIALAALIVGGWRPVQTLLACVAFAILEALAIQFQGSPILGFTLPAELWGITPYVITLLALSGLVGRVKAPAGLGKI